MGGKEGRKKASFYKTSTRVKGGGGGGKLNLNCPSGEVYEDLWDIKSLCLPYTNRILHN